jgi:hypothetical protein
VKQLGTEGRNAEIGKSEVLPPAEMKVFPFVEFAVKLIKNITSNELIPEPEVDECITIL